MKMKIQRHLRIICFSSIALWSIPYEGGSLINSSSVSSCSAFLPNPIPNHVNRAFSKHIISSQLFENNRVLESEAVLTTKSSTLDEKLNAKERTVVNVVRQCGPSVAFVSSSINPPKSANPSRRRRRRNNDNLDTNNENRGTSLGSGSAFCISSEGYFITNYHVIERAYSIQKNQVNLRELVTNITEPILKSPILTNINPNSKDPTKLLNLPEAQVYLRLSPTGSSTSSKPQPCRIVAVRPEVDIAVLYLGNNSTIPTPAIPYGLSSELLVGQSVIAIGNPFGLTQTVTEGIVSALDRTFSGVGGKDIRGCIQTDAAINPGNSGGPLLDVSGNVVGVNAAIVSPSGGSSGIGFAIGMDDYLRKDIERIVENDLSTISSSPGRKKGWLGTTVVEDAGLIRALWKKMNVTQTENGGVFVLDIKSGSPAEEAGIKSLKVLDGGARVQVGDRIVALQGNLINEPSALVADLKMRVEGEQISITVEDPVGNRRVVYVSLGSRGNTKTV